MEWIQKGLVALAIGLPAMLALMVGLAAVKLSRLRLQRSRLAMVDAAAVPAQVRATLDTARPLLLSLGFEFRYTTASGRALVTDDTSPLFADVYQHADKLAHAIVTPSPQPEEGEPCTVMWATQLQSSRVLATVNCYRHNLITEPAGWAMYDDYLPDLRQAWQQHLQRLPANRQAILADGVEFFRASKEATDHLISFCQKKGLLVQRGACWQMPLHRAVVFAWKLFRGQRRVARARAQRPLPGQPGAPAASAAPAPQDQLQAGIQAFRQQLAVQRATRWSQEKKVKVFLLTAALFLAVGSLWITWTFLPILLAVIALHEGGHYLAMKISGYRNLSVFFLPGLGGLATGEKPAAGPWEKLFVYLAGPMPGIALAVAALVASATGSFEPPPWLSEFLVACLLINYLNLLPITPLDGGRVVETFLFARLPVARFGFALLGLAAFLGLGLWSGDYVLLVVAVFLVLALPHQWRVMRVDRAIERQPAETLDEGRAIERVFQALQLPKFARWPFATRAAAAMALLPELQGRRAGVAEAVGGMAIYLVCLVAPLAAAYVGVPQVAGLANSVVAGYERVPDDVDPAPGGADATRERDWFAEAAGLQSLPESQRLAVLLGAAEYASDMEETEKLQGFLQAAWAIAEKRPPRDHERARTLLALARQAEEPARRRDWYRQLVAGLDGLDDAPSLLLLAQAKQEMTWGHDLPAAQRVALLREVVAYRQQALEPGDATLLMTRRILAQELDAHGATDEAEALLRANVAGLAPPEPAQRTWAALQRRVGWVQAQVELGWFLTQHGRAREASAMLETALALVPQRVSESWEQPNRQAREAQLWADLQHPEAVLLKQRWLRYEESRGRFPNGGAPRLIHEVDRFVVGRAMADAAMQAAALVILREVVADRQADFVRARLCEEHQDTQQWRAKQRLARVAAAKAAGLCASAAGIARP